MHVLGKKNARTIRLYSQDPAFTEDRSKDPLEALHIIFAEADEIGRGDLARKAIDYLATAIGDSSYDMPAVRSPYSPPSSRKNSQTTRSWRPSSRLSMIRPMSTWSRY